MKEPLLRISAVSKRFADVQALNGVSLDLEKGTLAGIAGPNGSGKTTLLRIVATLEKPDAGGVFVEGLSAARFKLHARRRIGFVPAVMGFYRDLSLEENLAFFSLLYRIADFDSRIEFVLDLFDLKQIRGIPMRELSAGHVQRCSLARCMLHDPELLLLDEPLSRLDPKGRMEMLAVLEELRDSGKTIFFSTHILSEMEKVCDTIAVLREGRMIYSGGVDNFISSGTGKSPWRLKTSGGADPRPILLESTQVLSSMGDESDVKFFLRPDCTDMSGFVEEFVSRGVRIASLNQVPYGIEDAYNDAISRAGSSGEAPEKEAG